MEFRIRTCQNRSGGSPDQRSIRQQAIVVVTAKVREEQARRLVPIVGARRAAGMKRSSGRRTKEDCLLLRASAFSVKTVAFLFRLRICFRRKNCWVKGMPSRRCAIRRRHFPRQTSPQKLSLLTPKKLASGNKTTGRFNVKATGYLFGTKQGLSCPLATDGAVTKKILQKDKRFRCFIIQICP